MPPPELHRHVVRRSIIAALALAFAFALPGCSLIKLGYGQASPLAFRWLDRYLDMDDAQSLQVRTALDETLAWHRRTQLPDYEQLLGRAEAEVLGDASPERMCAWAAEIRSRIDPVLQHLAPTIADLALTLTPAQLAHAENRFAASNGEWRDEHLQSNPQRRRKAEVKRELERAEMLYGDLDAAQRELIVQSVATSPYSAELADAERTERQHDVLAFARRLRATNRGREEAIEQVRAYLGGLDRSPREAYRRHAEAVARHHCALASALHNSTSAQQRREAAKRLAGYRADVRSLLGDAAP